jgi:hypothetical protein
MSDDLEWSPRSSTPRVDDDSRVAVVAHSLLGSVAAVRGAIGLVLATESKDANPDSLLVLAARRLDAMTEQLRNLAAGRIEETLSFFEKVHEQSSEVELCEGTRVEVHSSFNDTWSPGFEIAETVIGGYRVRRASDGSVLAGLVANDSVRVVSHPSLSRNRRT